MTWEDYRMRGKRFVILKTMTSFGRKYFRGERGIVRSCERYDNNSISSLLIQKDGARLVGIKKNRHEVTYVSGRLKVEIL